LKYINIFQVDAFTPIAFKGNPAAVCPLPQFLPDETLQAIAGENNLSETAYIVELDGSSADYHLRWFTPTVEVKMCGHATLAAAFVVFNHLRPDSDTVRFDTLSGILTVRRMREKLLMDFPVLTVAKIETPVGLVEAMGHKPTAVYKGEEGDRDLLLVYDSPATIQKLTPDSAALRKFAPYGFIATARGAGDIDFVSRCFFPNHGIEEDAVTGSAHCVMGPYWSEKLGKKALFARQLSKRGGDLWLNIPGDGRMEIAGQAVEVMKGEIIIPT